MIHIRGVTLFFGEQAVFDDVNQLFARGQRIGFVGRNGSGKTTLFNSIVGLQDLDSGSISIEKGKTLAYMPQETTLQSQRSVIDEALHTHEQYWLLKNEYDACMIINDSHTSADVATPASIALYDRIGILVEQLSYYSFDTMYAEAHDMLTGLGFTYNMLQVPVDTLSCGWKMRLVLAKLLLKKADFYLFDEPTNHLDIVSKDWFYSFLMRAPFGFLLVSHERFLLDSVCESIFELSVGKARLWKGNYTTYEANKKHEEAMRLQAWTDQQKVIKQKEQTIERFRASANKARMAQSMIKSLDKIERVTIDRRASSMVIPLPEIQQSGRVVLTVKNVAKAYGEKTLFTQASLELMRGEKVAIVAANGVGKSTLLHIVAEKIAQDVGSVAIGHAVNISFFEQDQTIALDSKKTILAEVESVCRTSQMLARVRSMLGAFLFSGDDVYKKIGVLSGGEKNRVAMVKVLLGNGNFLILDEPTNHLDIDSKDILLTSLKSYKGTILFVSHDRAFLDGLATKVFELTPQGLFGYTGNYTDYLHYREHAANSEKAANFMQEQEMIEKPVEKVSGSKNNRNKGPANLERTISKLEKRLADIYASYDDSENIANNIESLNAQVIKIKAELDGLYAEWEAISK